MRSCHISRFGLAALVMAAWVILANLSISSFGQDNPLRSSAQADPAPAELNANQERQLVECLASIFSQPFRPWMRWFTLVSQMPNPFEASVNEEPNDTIIEIPELAMQAIDSTWGANQASGEYDSKGDLFIGDEKEDLLSESTLEKSMERDVEETSDNEPVAQPVPLRLRSVSKPSPPRNLRNPRPLEEMDSLDRVSASPPRSLSESMKSKSEGTSIQDVPTKRSIQSSDEDMRDYLAQEEPSTESIRNSIHDQMQGVDADRAAKPDTRNAPEDGFSRSPGKEGAIHDKPLSNIPASMQKRLARVQGCTEHYLRNPETTSDRSPWAVMHALLPYGADYELIGPKGRVNAIGWMCHNGLCRTQRIFTPRGEFFIPNVGGGVQGHEGQFLAILAQSQVPLDYPIQIGSKKFLVEDLVRYEMATCKERSELTFKLIGLSYYVDASKQWRTKDGKVWNLEKLLREELSQPIVGAACGGTHRLMGLSFCLRQRELQGLPINGQFARAAQFVNDYVRYTWQLQNPDGSFSTNWYAGRGNEPNDERKVQTSGHMLEWLMFTVSDEEMTSPRVEKAVDFLLSKIYDRRDFKWPIGPRGHATRALALYHLRIEALLEQRSDASNDALAQKRVEVESVAKTAISPVPKAPRRQPASQPTPRSTSRPNRRVRG